MNVRLQLEPPGRVVLAVTNIIVRVSRIILLNTGAPSAPERLCF